MIKYMLLLFFCVTTKFQAQILKFDILAIYTKTSSEEPYNISVYAVSDNSDFIMRVFNLPEKKQKATVYDFRNNLSHEFVISEYKDENDSIVHKFIYEKSQVFKNPHVINYYGIDKISSDEEFETYSLKIFKNKFKKKVVNEYIIKNIKAEKNLFYLFNYACLDLKNFESEICFKDFGLVTECHSIENKHNCKLEVFEEVDLELTIPNLLIK